MKSQLSKTMAKKRTIELTIAGYTFSLKNLQVHDDMSDETTCFSAELYCDGKKIARCNNDGHGGETNVYIVGACDLKSAVEIGAPLVAIKNFRDEEYEKLMNERMKMYNPNYDGEPWVQLWTDEHLCDTLMEKQAAWDDAVKQLKKIAKQHPKLNVFFNGDRVYVASKDTPIEEGFEDVTEYVR